MPSELSRAFEYGIAIDASALDCFGDEARSDLLLHPDPETLAVLPWRPEHGRVIRLFCDITYPDGKTFECDTRSFLKKPLPMRKRKEFPSPSAQRWNFTFLIWTKTASPPGFLTIMPDIWILHRMTGAKMSAGEICLTLEQMGIRPESSHHEQGPGQNEIDFRYSDALSAADNAMTFSDRGKDRCRPEWSLRRFFHPSPSPDSPEAAFILTCLPKVSPVKISYLI